MSRFERMRSKTNRLLNNHTLVTTLLIVAIGLPPRLMPALMTGAVALPCARLPADDVGAVVDDGLQVGYAVLRRPLWVRELPEQLPVRVPAPRRLQGRPALCGRRRVRQVGTNERLRTA